MTDQKQPETVADEDLEDVTGGLYSMAGGGSELTRQRKGYGSNSFGNDASTVIDDDAQDGNLVSFGAETTP